MNPGLVVLIGMGVVFAGLGILIIAISIMNAIIPSGSKENKPKIPAGLACGDELQESEIDHNTLVAICAAAIATESNSDAAGIRIRSITRV